MLPPVALLTIPKSGYEKCNYLRHFSWPINANGKLFVTCHGFTKNKVYLKPVAVNIINFTNL